jgi:hypothetical protein
MDFGSGKAKRRELFSEENLSRAGQIGLSGGVTGAILGGAGSSFTAPNIKSILKAAAIGAGTSAGIASGANLAGSAIMSGDEEDENANMRRGAVGGGLLGGAAGTGLGAMATTGRMPNAAAGSLLQKTVEALRRRPYGALVGALGGALVGTAAGSYLGADEGMQYDTIERELGRRR